VVAATLLLATLASPVPGVDAEAFFDCRTTAEAVLPLPDRSLGVAVTENTFSLIGSDAPPLARERVVSRSNRRLQLVGDVEGFDAYFEAELVQSQGAWRIEWRVIQPGGPRGELIVAVEGAGACNMSGAVT
jgi:hypothetical protein